MSLLNNETQEYDVPTEITVRAYRSDDLAQAQALDARMQPYRPEDEPEVEAMFERARGAKERGDWWMPLPPGPSPESSIELAVETYIKMWVAWQQPDDGAGQVVGIVGVSDDGEDLDMPDGMPLAREWRRREDVAQLTHLRVAPEVWRRGVGTQLSQTVIEWCREHEYRTVVLNTSSAQTPALGLYRKLGFQEVGRSYIDRYELVWHRLEL